MELSKTIALNLFSIFLMSFLGICMKVSPKKTLLGLNIEWKHNLLLVMYSLPLSSILSLKAQEKLLKNFYSGRNAIFVCKKSAYLLPFSPFYSVFFYSATIYSFSPFYLDFLSFLSMTSSFFSTWISMGFFSFLNSSILDNSDSKTIFPGSSLRSVPKLIYLKNTHSLDSALSMSA